MRTWLSYRRLSRADRRLALETAAALLMARLGLRLVGLQRLRDLLVRLVAREQADVSPSTAVEVGHNLAAIHQAVSRHLPWQASCLEKSLVLWWQLARRGIAAELRIGARKEAGRFEAHAWVEAGNVVLNDCDESHIHFAPFDGSILTLET